MAYPYPLAFPDPRQLHASSYSALSGALEPTFAQSGHSVKSNATGYADAIPISTYLRAQPSPSSTLSGALGPVPFQSQHHNITPQASTSNAIYSSSPHALGYEESSVNLHYPYPQRNIIHPANYPVQIPSTSNQTSNKTVIPSGYHRLSLSACLGKEDARPSSWSRLGREHAPIKFNRKGGGKPFRVDELLKTNETPEVEGRLDQVFKNIGDRYIKVILTWPGYSKFPVERRICTENGTLTRDKLLVILAKHIEEFMHYVHRKEITVEKGYEKYELLWRPSGLPSVWRDCMITSLAHRSGSMWEVELYVRV
ncbi:hypothetical protein AZE42_07579 [Rhizopogon vesiculosus]|uniref:Uncharacterized protein n=1 Tax=Rhizopogon vesiculosus TaxID=180088 RepID=A0A1J8PYC2_9AGAM|nr:hypothetical protein AZE42_07579 [Rhizopogon vesiculosus]